MASDSVPRRHPRQRCCQQLDMAAARTVAATTTIFVCVGTTSATNANVEGICRMTASGATSVRSGGTTRTNARSAVGGTASRLEVHTRKLLSRVQEQRVVLDLINRVFVRRTLISEEARSRTRVLVRRLKMSRRRRVLVGRRGTIRRHFARRRWMPGIDSKKVVERRSRRVRPR